MSRRPLLLILGSLLTLSLLLSLGGLWLLTTEAGLQAAWTLAVPLARQMAGIEMQAQDLRGTLLGPMQVREFHYRDPWVDVQVSQATVHWQPGNLLAARIQIDSVVADQARVALLEAVYTDSEDPGEEVLLPVTVHIRQASIAMARFLLTEQSTPWIAQPLEAAVRIERDRVAVDTARGSAYGADIDAHGFIVWNEPYEMTLTAHVEQTLPDRQAIRSDLHAEGDLGAFGMRLESAPPYPGRLDMQWREKPAGYAIDLQGAPEPAPLLVALGLLPPAALATGPVEVTAQGLLTATGFDTERLTLRHGDGLLEARGKIDWSEPRPVWSGEADWQTLQLPPWEPLAASDSGHAEFQGEALNWQATLDAGFTIRDQKPGRIRLQAQAEQAAVEITQGIVSAGRSRIEVSGACWPRADLNWSANSPHLGELWPGAQGRITGSGKLSGDWPLLRVLARLQGAEVAAAGLQAGQFGIEVDLDLEKDSRGYVRAHANGLAAGDTQVTDLRLDIDGRRTDHRVEVSWHAPRISGSASAGGRWQTVNAPWLLTIDSLQLRPALDPPAPPPVWQLASTTGLSLHRDRQALDNSCLQHNGASICLQASRQDGEWQARADLTRLPLAILGPWLPTAAAGLQLEGGINGKANITGMQDQWQNLQITADGRAALSRSGLEDELDLTLHGLGISASPASWHTELELQISDSGRLSMEAAVEPDGREWRAARLRGDLRLDMPHLQELAVVAPEIEQLRGALKGEIGASGTLGQPVLGGRLILDKGRLDLRDYGISLAPLSATVSGQSDDTLKLEIAAESGGGRLSASGQARADWRQPSLALHIRGQNFLAARTDEATVYVSPDLNLSVQNRDVELTGRIEVPEAQLKPRAQATAAQTVSPDQVLVNGKQAEPAQQRWNLLARVKLILGDKVFFNGMGINTRLAGQLDLHETPGKLTAANGEIRLQEGSYETYGQKLSIETGRLIFANAPVTQPALDIKATRTPRPNITVGVRVRGLLDAPEVSLFSSPAMRQAEQLSYLVLGRPLAGNEGNPALAEAALAMGLKRGDRYIRGFGDTIGVDEIGLETSPGESGQQASLVVGKYLSPRLYVSYGAGLFEPLHRLRLRYRLSEHWTAVGESGTVQGADILYTIER